MTRPQGSSSACERVLEELKVILEGGAEAQESPLLGHLSTCHTCNVLITVARDVSSGCSLVRTWIDDVTPQSLVRDTARLILRALREHKNALARVYKEIGRSCVYESHGNALKLVVLTAPKARKPLYQEASEIVSGARELARGVRASAPWIPEEVKQFGTAPLPPNRMIREGGYFLEAAQKLEPRDEDIKLWLGSYYEGVGWKKLAEEMYEDLARGAAKYQVKGLALTNRHRNPGSPSELATSMAATGNAALLFPEHPGPLANLVLFSIIAGEAECAYSSMGRLAAIGPSDLKVQRAVSLALLSNGGPVFGGAKEKQKPLLKRLVRDYPSLLPEEFVEGVIPAIPPSMEGDGNERRVRRRRHHGRDRG